MQHTMETQRRLAFTQGPELTVWCKDCGDEGRVRGATPDEAGDAADAWFRTHVRQADDRAEAAARQAFEKAESSSGWWQVLGIVAALIVVVLVLRGPLTERDDTPVEDLGVTDTENPGRTGEKSVCDTRSQQERRFAALLDSGDWSQSEYDRAMAEMSMLCD